jgi:hypothetical protein
MKQNKQEVSMTVKVLVAVIVAELFFWGSFSYGFEITRPKNGEIFRPGDKVVVELKVGPTENLKGVMFYTLKIHESDINLIVPYNFEFTIPLEFMGTETIVANGKLQDDSHIESKVQINVVIPSNIVLKDIVIDRSKIYLTKMPAGTLGSNFYEQRQLRIKGQFSDGVVRDLSSSATGTEYLSSNSNIAIVDQQGLVTAVSPGDAKITIKNGGKQVEISVAVKMKR